MPEGVGYASSNVVASTGLELNYVGDRCFAYSGTFNVNTTAFTMLNFTTGSKTIKGKFYGYGPVKFDSDINTGKFGGFQCSLNGNVVAIMKSDTGQHDMGQVLEFECILPPYTNVEVQGLASATTAGFLMEVNFTGQTLE
jgi:hypothetical protein